MPANFKNSAAATGLEKISWSVFIPIPKKRTAKECSNYHTVALISYAANWCSKFSKRGFNSMWTMNLQMFKLDLEEAEEPEIKLPNIHWIIEKAIKFQKNIYFCFIDYTKAFDCVDQNKLWKILQEMGIPDYFTCLLRNLYADQQTTVRTRHGSKSGKEYSKAIYCHTAYLTYMQSTSWETLGWRKYKL